MSQVVAERELEFHSDNAVGSGYARLFLPYYEGPNWRCDYEIVWPGFEHKSGACGVDSWQALQLAMQIIPVEISASDGFKAGKLAWLEGKIDSEADLVRWLAPKSMDVLDT
jgi:hypothetical protein